MIAIARWGLLIWGALSLVGVIFIAATFFPQLGPGDRIDSASKRDVRFVLNWCGLGDERIEKVIRSHVGARSSNGDHLDAYAIQISYVELAELTKPTKDLRSQWHRGDALPQVLDDALGFVIGWRYRIPWFPSEAELRSSAFYVYPWSVHLRGLDPSAAELIFVRPADRMVFYFEGQM